MRLWHFLVCAAAFVVACGGENGTSDGGPTDGSVGIDAPSACTGAADGSPCGEGMICNAGVCAASECQDGVLDARSEECDDGNEVAFDGCEADCTFTCDAHSDCDDARPCNGAETCAPGTHSCERGARAEEGTPCTDGSVEDGVCRTGVCVAAGCGNSIVEAGEECDDGNELADDGCESDCSFTCTSDAHCDDANPCNGAETCDASTPTAPVCAAGAPFDCTPADACHTSVCDPAAVDPAAPCVETLTDADADGEPPSSLGACGTDCDDANPDVRSSAVEVCGNTIDDDCNPGTVDSATTTYYVDCDLDGFAASDTGAVVACEVPTTLPCPGSTGGWTTRIPLGATNIDCQDFNPSVRPNQLTYFTSSYLPSSGGGTSFDYNCNTTADKQYSAVAGSTCELEGRCTRPPCGPDDLYCRGTSGWSGSAPACGVGGTYRTCSGAPRTCPWDGRAQTGCTLLCDPSSRSCCLPGMTGCRVTGSTSGTFCTPGSFGCAITCTPNSFGCIWAYLSCPFSSASRTQACR